MKRIALLLILMVGVASLSSCGGDEGESTAAGQTSAEKFRWRMVTSWPPNFPVFQEGTERFAEHVKVMSNGRLTIKSYAGGELIPPLQVFDAVSQGTVEMGHSGAYYWAGKIPAAQFFTSVPFGLNAQGMNAWLYSGGGLELWRETYAPHNMIPFPLGNTGVQMGGWFNKKIDSLDDLDGLKMRIPGLGGKVFAEAGGNAVLMAGGELYTALERGAIDATEWVGPYHDKRLGLPKAAKYYYYPGWHEPGSTLELVVNKGAWDKLPEDLQRIVEVAAQATDLWMLTRFEALNAEALSEIKAMEKVEMLPFPSEVTRKLKSLTHKTMAEQAEADPQFAKVYAAYQAFQLKHDAWSEISERAYYDALMGN